jgi:hypothetical protein
VIEFINLNQLKYSWPSDEELIEAYKSDKDLDPIYTYRKENRVPEATIVNGVKNDMVALEILRKAHLYLLGKDGKLYHYADKKNRPEKLVLCVPRKYIKLILEETHDSLWAGAHMGRDKTLDKIKEKYHFRDMKNIVSWYIKSCIPCQESKRKQPTQALPWGTIQSKGTWDLLCLDLWDSGVTSSRGNRYILTVIDGFSKFAHAIPIRNKEAVTVAKCLVEKVFCAFGIPRRLHSDRGAEFVNEVITNIALLYMIEKGRTTAYHPQGNAYAERIHQFFRNSLCAFVNRSQRNWDMLIPILVSVYNGSLHEALGGHSPFQVMFGRDENNSPIQLPLGDEYLDPKKYLSSLKLALDRVQQEVTEQMYAKMLRNINKNEGYKFKTYNLGDKVAVSVEYLPAGFTSAKLYPKWKGPYEVIKLSRDGKVLYLKDMFDNELQTPVSVLRTKRWYERETKENEIVDDEEKEQNNDELQTRLTERLEGDVSVIPEEIPGRTTNIPDKPIKRKGKDWSFIDTKEFKVAKEQSIKFVGRSPRIRTHVDYSKEQTIYWFEI